MESPAYWQLLEGDKREKYGSEDQPLQTLDPFWGEKKVSYFEA
jgi:hypothetical protein